MPGRNLQRKRGSKKSFTNTSFPSLPGPSVLKINPLHHLSPWLLGRKVDMAGQRGKLGFKSQPAPVKSLTWLCVLIKNA